MDRGFQTLWRLPIGGLVVTLVALLGYWNANQLRLGFENVWPTAAAAAVCVIVLTFVLRFSCASWDRAGVVATMLAVYLFYVPVLVSVLGFAFSVSVALHAGVIAGLVLIYRAMPKDPSKFQVIAHRMNMVCAAVFMITLLPLAVQQVRLETHRANAAGSLGRLEGRAAEAGPDVWHILLDRYAAVDTLQERYRFDNGPFIAALRARGFAVQDRAYSNYQRTSHSVASTMNGTLLDPIAEPMKAAPADWVPVYRAMRDSAAVKAFNDMGYRTVFAGSWWEPTRFSDSAQRSITIRAVPQLARLMIDHSAIGFWTQGLRAPYFDGRMDQCFRANEKFRLLREIAKDSERKHVFAHFLIPHPPFVLSPDGRCKSAEEARKTERRKNYVDQVRFVNREVLRLVDAIALGSRPAVIVLHSDEGPWPAPYIGDEHGLGTDPVPVPWRKLSKTQLQEKMAILLAVRAPSGRRPATMPTSPVQIYPAILKDHFGSSKPLPPSGHYVFESDTALYRFHDVGDRLTR